MHCGRLGWLQELLLLDLLAKLLGSLLGQGLGLKLCLLLGLGLLSLVCLLAFYEISI